MDTVFFVPEQRAGQTGDAMSSEHLEHMSSVGKQLKHSLIGSSSAANADLLDEAEKTVTMKGIEATGSWDAYDVWRRFIKEARERRKGQDAN